MFRPLCCPYRGCPQNLKPVRDFYTRAGFYHPKCRAHAVPRFRCRSCERTFSRQTFRVDYRDHKPHLNAAVFKEIATGMGLRQAARKVGLSYRGTQQKFRKLGRHLRRLNLNLRGQLPAEALLHFDEFETYEGQRNTRPLSIPLLIETKTRFIIWAEAAPIRPRGKMTKKRLKTIAKSEIRHGIRRDTSKRSVKRTLIRGAEMLQNGATVTLKTDEKSSYPHLAKQILGVGRLTHLRTNSKEPRMTFNPLFPINHEEAVARDLMGRLRRQSWLVTKKRRFLDLALQIHMAYRNLVEPRFNYDTQSPAQLLGFLTRRLKLDEALSWRQDWQSQSIHPLSPSARSIQTWNRRAVGTA